MKIRTPRTLAGLAVVGSLTAVGLAAPSFADNGPSTASPTPVVAAADDAVLASVVDVNGVDGVDGAESDGPGPDGVIVSTEGDDHLSPACEAALDQVWSALEGVEVEAFGELDDLDELDELDADWTPSAQEVELLNAETDAIVSFLAGKGYDVEVETDEFGINHPLIDDLLDSLSDEEFDALFDEFVAANEDLLAELDALDDLEGEWDEELEAELEAQFDAAFDAALVEADIDPEFFADCEEQLFALEGEHCDDEHGDVLVLDDDDDEDEDTDDESVDEEGDEEGEEEDTDDTDEESVDA